jgi:hypothetical protein
MDTKYIQDIYPHSPFLVPTHSHWYLLLEKTYFCLLPFICFKCILIVKGGFALVFQACVYPALVKSTLPLLLTHPLLQFSPNIQKLTVQCTILYSYIDGLFQYFSFFSIFFYLSCLQWSPQSDSLTQFCSLPPYTYACETSFNLLGIM